jgi:hypothetical protein
MDHTRRNREAGIALVLALLSLMLLTFLGLTLATTTSTELQISNNYRWSQQAFYNAEAGIEVGKKVLATADWSTILPAPRATLWDALSAPATAADGSASPANRNYENWSCDWRGNGAGYGRVLNDGSTTYNDVTSAYSQPINGAFTLWVRRPIVADDSGMLTDYGPADQLILTAEGIAPSSDASVVGTTLGQQNRAVRTIEITVSRTSQNTGCGTLSGQVGGGAGGAGFGACTAIDPTSIGRSLGLPGAPAENTTAR